MKNSVLELRLKVPQKDIYYISWNLDACEGLGFLMTVDAASGKVTIFSPACMLNELLCFIRGHREEGIEMEIENLDEMQEIMNEHR